MKIEQIFAKDYPKNKTTIFYYESDYYYDVEVIRRDNGWTFNLVLKKFAHTFVKNVKEQLFADYKEPSECYVAKSGSDEEMGVIMIGKQEWNNLTRVWDISVDQRFQRKGIGTRLLKLAEERARAWNHRAIVLETQSSNFSAIQFYLKFGFDLRGLDIVNYSNEDIENHEVRFEMYKLVD